MTLKQTHTSTLKDIVERYDKMQAGGKALPPNQQKEYDTFKAELVRRENEKK